MRVCGLVVEGELRGGETSSGSGMADKGASHDVEAIRAAAIGLHGHDPTTSPTPTTIEEVHEQMDELADFLRAKMLHMSSTERAADFSLLSSVHDDTAADVAARVWRSGQREAPEYEVDFEPGYRARRLASDLDAADGHDAHANAASLSRHVAMHSGDEGMGSVPAVALVATESTAVESIPRSAAELDASAVPEGLPPISHADAASPDRRQSWQTKAHLRSKLYPEHDSPTARARRASSELERLLARSSAETAALSPRRSLEASAEAVQVRVPLTRAPTLSPTTHGAASAVSEAALVKQRAATEAAIASTPLPTKPDLPETMPIQELLRQRHRERDADIVYRSARRQAEINYQASNSPRFFGRETSPTSLEKYAKASAAAAAATAERLSAPSPTPSQNSSFSLVEESENIGQTLPIANHDSEPVSSAPTSASTGALGIDWAALRSPESTATRFLSPSTFGVAIGPDGPGRTTESQVQDADGACEAPAEVSAAAESEKGEIEGEGEHREYQGRSPFVWRDATPETAHLAWTPTRQSTLRGSRHSAHDDGQKMTTAQRQPQLQLQQEPKPEPEPQPRNQQPATQHRIPSPIPSKKDVTLEGRAHSPSSKASDADRRLQELLAASPLSAGC